MPGLTANDQSLVRPAPDQLDELDPDASRPVPSTWSASRSGEVNTTTYVSPSIVLGPPDEARVAGPAARHRVRRHRQQHPGQQQRGQEPVGAAGAGRVEQVLLDRVGRLELDRCRLGGREMRAVAPEHALVDGLVRTGQADRRNTAVGTVVTEQVVDRAAVTESTVGVRSESRGAGRPGSAPADRG